MSLAYEGKLIDSAKTLRKNMTRQERHLWYDYLRGYPFRFQRQKVIGHYIVDFYCHALKLVIELDGSQHYEPEAKQRDDERTAYLESLGLTVERFSNYDIDRNFTSVCDRIDQWGMVYDSDSLSQLR